MSTTHSGSPPRIGDLAILIGTTLGAAIALLVPGLPWIVEWAFGLPLLLVLPGYAIVSALFPTAPTPTLSKTGPDDSPGWSARVAIALVLSVVSVVIIGVGLSMLGSLALTPVVMALVTVTSAATLIAWIRRRRVEPGKRADIRSHIAAHTTPSQLGLSRNQALALGVAVLLLGAGTVAAGVIPPATTSYSEAALLSPDTGTALGMNGTVQFAAGEQNTVTLRLENHEGGAMTYGAVGVLQDVTSNGTVVESRELDRGRLIVADGETLHSERTVTPTRTEHRARLQYLVYTGPIPEDPTAENAALALRIWVEYDGSSP